MGALIPNRSKDKARDVAVLFGRSMQDHREELFVVMVCDGLPLGLAFRRAGFESKAHDAPSNLFNLPRVQERARAILEARRETGVVTLPQVTDMLQRVFASAHAAEEFSAAHNAAFSLARLYGHVTDKSVIEHIRRPSRDPDAPSETALEAWAASLPVVSPDPQLEGTKAPLQGPPAHLLGPEPLTSHGSTTQLVVDWPQGPGLDGAGGIGNGAPVGPVTGTPHARGGSELLGEGTHTGGGSDLSGPVSRETGTGTRMGEVGPEPDRQDSETDVVIPSFEQLFGDGGESR